MSVETFRGTAPRCRHCNTPLRPNYESEIEETWNTPADQKKYRRVYRAKAPEYTEHWWPTSPPDDPSQSFEEDDCVGSRRGGWDAKSQQWYYFEVVTRVKSRKFLGTFGSRGDNLFCNPECGYRFAIRQLRGA